MDIVYNYRDMSVMVYVNNKRILLDPEVVLINNPIHISQHNLTIMQREEIKQYVLRKIIKPELAIVVDNTIC